MDALRAGLDGTPVVLIQGPPGTGKTRTILNLLSVVMHSAAKGSLEMMKVGLSGISCRLVSLVTSRAGVIMVSTCAAEQYSDVQSTQYSAVQYSTVQWHPVPAMNGCLAAWCGLAVYVGVWGRG